MWTYYRAFTMLGLGGLLLDWIPLPRAYAGGAGSLGYHNVGTGLCNVKCIPFRKISL